MKKSFLKKLSRMARDGDPEAIEALAEAVEEILEDPAAEGEAAVVIAAQAEPETAPEEPAAAEPTGDEDVMAAILEKLDRLIALMTPAQAEPAADEEGGEEEAGESHSDLPEELAEVVEEAVEAAREGENMLPEEVAAIVEEVVAEGDPDISSVLEPEEQDCGGRNTADTLRVALKAVRPTLLGMNARDRNRVCADIARRLKFTVSDSRDYAALACGRGKKTADTADLGKQIMARRNPNYKK